MEYVVQVIMIIVCIAVVIIIMYFCCTKCRHTCTIFKYCFPFLPISHVVRMSHCTDLFVEVSNITKGNSMWAHCAVLVPVSLVVHVVGFYLFDKVKISMKRMRAEKEKYDKCV